MPIENQGVIPTALKQAQLVRIVRPDTVSLVFPAGMTRSAPACGRGGRGGGPAGAMEGMGGAACGQRAGQARPRGAGGHADGTAGARVRTRSSSSSRRPPAVTIDRLAGNEKKPVTFKIRLNGITGTDCTVRYASTRGGVVEKKIVIGKK